MLIPNVKSWMSNLKLCQTQRMSQDSHASRLPGLTECHRIMTSRSLVSCLSGGCSFRKQKETAFLVASSQVRNCSQQTCHVHSQRSCFQSLGHAKILTIHGQDIWGLSTTTNSRKYPENAGHPVSSNYWCHRHSIKSPSYLDPNGFVGSLNPHPPPRGQNWPQRAETGLVGTSSNLRTS